MIYALITLFLLIGIVYQRDRQSVQLPGQSFLRKYRQILLLAGLVVVPLLVMNAFFPDPRTLSLSEQLEEAKKNDSREDLLEAYEKNLQVYPDSIPLYFDYMDVRQRGLQTCAVIDFSEFTDDPELTGICHEYHMIQCRESDEELHAVGSHDFDPDKTRFANYVRGLRAIQFGRYDIAESYFRKEIKLNPSFDRAYVVLYHLYRDHNSSKLEEFLRSDKMTAHLPHAELQYAYFQSGHYLPYIRQILIAQYSRIPVLAFLAGLVISIVWLIYLRSLDIYRMEKWVDIISVFIGGVFLAGFCLPFYHYAHYVLHFSITGDSLNDFLYCTVVIGGSEETVKMLPWVIFALATRKLREPYDYLLYASVSALGFAFAENWMYLDNPHNIAGRFIMSTVGHMFDASLLAYSVILARYKFKKIIWKVITPIAGFALACLSHGFYDFWLISPATKGLTVITIVFLVLSIHVWFFFKNNAMNHSQYYHPRPFRVDFQLSLFTFGVIGILMLEYVLVSMDFGAKWANHNLRSDTWAVGAFLLYMTFNLKQIQPVRGVWRRYSLPGFTHLKSILFELPDSGERIAEKQSAVGLSLRLFAPKTNPYIGALLPVSGVCERRIHVNGDPEWYVFRLNRPLGYPGFNNERVILRPKQEDQVLHNDKIEIYLMLIPVHLQPGDHVRITDLRYAGRVYSRPI